MRDLWIEVTPIPKHGTPPVLVELDSQTEYVGFRSVYAYPASTKEWIENNWSDKWQHKGSTVGLAASKMPVFSERLFVDFDENPIEDGKKLTKMLREMGIGYSVWSTGGRSIHVHIFCEPKQDWRVPVSQKLWIGSWAASVGARVDLSIYHAAGLYRLPGTIHSKSGKEKELLDINRAGLLNYELVDDVTAKPSVAPTEAGEALRSLWRQALQEDVASRHFHIFKLTSQADRLGLSPSYIEEICTWWNSRIKNPLDREEVLKKIYQTIR